MVRKVFLFWFWLEFCYTVRVSLVFDYEEKVKSWLKLGWVEGLRLV